MTTKEKIAVMQAFVDGKPCEYRKCGTNPWLPLLTESDYEACWDWYGCEFRIKPEPREVWVMFDDKNKTPVDVAYDTYHVTERKWFKFREVLE